MADLTLRLLVSLIAGLAGGVLCAPWTSEPVQLLFAAGTMIAALAHANHRYRLRDAAAWMAVACAAWLSGLHAVDRALHPSLRTLLEQRLGGFAIEADESSTEGSDTGSAGGAGGGLEREGSRDESRLVEGRLRQDAALGATGVVLRMTVERVWLGPHPEAAAGGVSVVVAGELAPDLLGDWTEGRRIRAPMVLRRPARYLNDGVPDIERSLARRGVALVGAIKSGALVEVVARGSWSQEWGARMRARVRRILSVHLSAGPAGAAPIATAILLGDRAALDTDVERRLQEAGTYHVLAISGGNIAILAGAVLGLMAMAGWRGRGAAGIAIVVLAAYGIVVEGGPSVLRATSMALLYLGIRLIDQRTAPANALALVVIGILIAEPLAIVEVGLWLTCGATLGILLGAERISVGTWPATRVVLALVMATVAAEAVLLPVAALVFERVTIAGVGLNLVAIPCMTVVQLGAMCLVGLDMAGMDGAASLAARVTEWGVAGLLGSASLVDYAPWLTWRVPAPSAWVVAAYYGALGVWWTMSRESVDTLRGRWALRTSGVMAASLLLWIATDPPTLARSRGDGRLYVTTIDVGQGDCALVTFPNGRRLLIDAGGVTVQGDFDIGDRIVGPALRARGLRRLDYLAVTHGDPDHIGGARAVLRDFAPMEVWQGVPVPGHERTVALETDAARLRAAWRTLQRGDVLEIGGVELRVLHPPLPDWERRKVRNDDSLVFELRLGAVSVLMTGDISREVEQSLLSSLTPLPRVVLKVPHHGSATSSSAAFVEALAPIVGTIGVGRGNTYGHPAPVVLDRYRRAGTAIFRTDQDGQIDVVTDGQEVKVRTFTGRVWGTDEHEGHEGHEERNE